MAHKKEFENGKPVDAEESENEEEQEGPEASIESGIEAEIHLEIERRDPETGETETVVDERIDGGDQ